MVRAHASHAEDQRFEPNSMPLLNARSLFTQQQMSTQWEHWGDKGGEERNWPPYLTCRWLRISVLSNRHSPTYRSIRDYLYFSMHKMQCILLRLLANCCKSLGFDCRDNKTPNSHQQIYITISMRLLFLLLFYTLPLRSGRLSFSTV